MDRKGVLIVGELVDGMIASITAELLTIGSRRASLDGEIRAVEDEGGIIGRIVDDVRGWRTCRTEIERQAAAIYGRCTRVGIGASER